MNRLYFTIGLLLLLASFCLQACNDTLKNERGLGENKNTPIKDYIRKIPGENDSIPEEIAQKGKVLIAYSDCYTCHSVGNRAKGPAFSDIAERYPVQEGYINMLASRVIAGGSGAWGSPIMSPHPDISHENARFMVSYILSLKEESSK